LKRRACDAARPIHDEAGRIDGVTREIAEPSRQVIAQIFIQYSPLKSSVRIEVKVSF
jgi:hypothetical protein